MKRMVLFTMFVIFPLVCFSQQNTPRRIIGQIPGADSPGVYQIQVGAFLIAQNAENLSSRLRREGLTVINERFHDFTRVIVSGIPANQMTSYLVRLKQLGIEEVIIREDRARLSISEKWEISDTESVFSSFEFNRDHNYIAVENPVFSDRIHFGRYTMPANNTIIMDNLGVLRVTGDNEDIDLLFSPIDEPETLVIFTASRAQRMPESARIDLFCRTWRVVRYSADPDYIGSYLFVSNAGTYFFTTDDDEENSLSQWRWYDDAMEEFEYSHSNWWNYGRARIIELTENSLKVFDPGFDGFMPGYTSFGMNDFWEFVPAN